MTQQLYRHYVKKKMIFFNPYAAFWVFEPKTTKTGEHNFKVGMSIGRQLARDRIKLNQLGSIDEEARKQLAEKLEKETGLRLGEPTFFERFRGFLINSWRRAGKWLGIEAKVGEGEFEIFEFVKFDEAEDILPLMIGMGQILGVICKHNKTNGRQIIEKAKDNLMIGFNKTGRYF